MKWKKRKREIAKLRARNRRKLGIPLPDLTCSKPGLAPCSNRFDSITDYSRPAPHTPNLIVDHFHKSGLQVILPSELPWAGGKKP